MNESLDRKNLELSVKNFGPIARADVDLRPMTVFVGPSNTGKSYLAILIYALHRFFNRSYGSRGPLGGMSRFASRRRGSPQYQDDLTDEDTARLVDWVDDLVSPAERRSPSDEYRGQLPDFIASLVRPILRDLGDSGAEIVDELRRSFGVADTKRLVRHRSRGGLRVALKQQSSHGSHFAAPFEYDLTMQAGTPELILKIPENASLYIDEADQSLARRFSFDMTRVRRELASPDDTVRRRAAGYLIRRITDLVVPNTVGPLSRVAHYLPADRTGIMHAHLVAVASVIERAPLTALRPGAPMPELSGVIADFLIQLVRLGDLSREGPRTNKNLAMRFEEKMLNGAIHTEDSITGYPEFYYRPEGWKAHLPLMNTSSMVSELAPVVLYLRHVVRPGEVLIIEEPESHLHPALQVEFIRQLAAVVGSGVRVMLTTHSEWVLDELANLVRLSDLSKSKVGKGIVRVQSSALSR